MEQTELQRAIEAILFAAGERVVTKGAISLKLSQGAAALDPHAGHVH